MIMNELSQIYLTIADGDTVTLEAGKVYHVRQDDAFLLDGYYCSNSAKQHENPTGRRYTALYLQGKRNVTLDGNGAVVMVHGKMTPILFDRCENITVKNLTVDYACPTMAELTVLSNEGGICELKINPDCLFRIENNRLIWQGETGADGSPYWEDDYQGNRRHVKRYDPIAQKVYDFGRDALGMAWIEQLDDTTLRCELKDKSVCLPAGSILQTRNIIRDQVGGIFQRCKNVLVEDCRIKFMHGLGMVSQFSENVTYRNCDLTPGEGRTIASTADFFQFSGCRGNLVVENCRAWGAQDDYINVHGTHLQVMAKNDEDKSIVVRFIHAESWGFQAFEQGDELEFIKWNTLQPFAKTKVQSYQRLNDTDIKLWLDRELPELELEKDVVENSSWTPNLYVRGCDFAQTAGRGILCTTQGEVLIENNRFYHLWGPALLIEDDCNFWFESGYTRKIVFRNNRVEGCDYGPTWENGPEIRYTPKVMDETFTGSVHGELILTGNDFRDAHFGDHWIWLEYVESAEITGNTFDAPYHIGGRCIGSVQDDNNTVV